MHTYYIDHVAHPHGVYVKSNLLKADLVNLLMGIEFLFESVVANDLDFSPQNVIDIASSFSHGIDIEPCEPTEKDMKQVINGDDSKYIISLFNEYEKHYGENHSKLIEQVIAYSTDESWKKFRECTMHVLKASNKF